jgi:hypothetical protein
MKTFSCHCIHCGNYGEVEASTLEQAQSKLNALCCEFWENKRIENN